MSVGEYLRILRKYWVSIGLIAVLAVAAGYVTLTRETLSYTTSASVFVEQRGGLAAKDAALATAAVAQQVGLLTQLATMPLVTQEAATEVGSGVTAAEVSGSVSTQVRPGTSIIDISVTSGNAELAAKIATSVAHQVAQIAEEKSLTNQTGDSLTITSVLSDAPVPAPNPRRSRVPFLLAWAGLGLLVGLAQALLRRYLNKTIDVADDLAKITDLPIVGILPVETVRDAATEHGSGTETPRRESLRRLRTNLSFERGRLNDGVILVTSSQPGEGHCRVGTELAISLASTGEPVLLIDADFREAGVASQLGVDNSTGLYTALADGVDRPQTAQPIADLPLHVLPSGPSPENPTDILASEVMGQILTAAAVTFRYVLVNVSPTLTSSDAALLGQDADAVLFVVSTGRTKESIVREALGTLATVHANVLGVVLNATRPQRALRTVPRDHAN